MRTLVFSLLLLLLPAGAVAQTYTISIGIPQFVGPLNKATSGTMQCGAVNSAFIAQDVTLTLHDKNGVGVATQTFNGVLPDHAVKIKVNPGAANSFVCTSNSVFGVRLSLSHLNSLKQTTASIGSATPTFLIAPTSIAGPGEPGLSHRVVCKGTTREAQTVETTLRRDDGVVQAQMNHALNAYGSGEVSVIAQFGRQYSCETRGLGGKGSQATLEGRTTLGIPDSAMSGTPEILSVIVP